MNIEIERVVKQIGFNRASLAERCRNLSDRLIALSKKLDSDAPHDTLNINDLGEIQHDGTNIDALCGRLMGKINVLGKWRIEKS